MRRCAPLLRTRGLPERAYHPIPPQANHLRARCGQRGTEDRGAPILEGWSGRVPQYALRRAPTPPLLWHLAGDARPRLVLSSEVGARAAGITRAHPLPSFARCCLAVRVRGMDADRAPHALVLYSSTQPLAAVLVAPVPPSRG